ncbi:NAD(P)H-quinone oxidoreductase [Ferrimonas sp. SCSIO 43195]|uniref:NAD(P)H-quinone oxidoreductase n=1 Tax=Ferrimonas sp. SCSIO 43195 TaxID=2822844 RepID=UPI002075A1D3|nr:NAD(P)H-quinone oxidoreductase [Ferrimonas sp. SCSIO 43195]USD39180.1 NAD(P)H-quinone oxidoreductase [Ferrimonas sp. SCSIO 43195]
MKAITIGPKGQLVTKEVPLLAAPDHWPLIRVKASGINRADLLQRAGQYPPPPGASDILGLEVAGEIAFDCGPWRRGQRVMALLDGGGYASEVRVPPGQVMALADTLSFEQGAAIPEAFLTAYQALFALAGLRAGETVLIHAGASGVGSAAIQLAHHADATVVVTCSSEAKAEYCRQLGAHQAINYCSGPWPQACPGVDVVVDVVGGDYLKGNLKVMNRDARLVSLSMLGGRYGELDFAPLLSKRITLMGSTLRNRSEAYKANLISDFEAEFGAALAEGELRATVDSVYPWSQVETAHQRMTDNQNCGKLLLSRE